METDFFFVLQTVVAIFISSSTICANQDSQKVVTIPLLGKIRGSFMFSASGRKFASFRNISYAKPPIGELRFKVLLLFDCLNFNKLSFYYRIL